MHGASIYFNFRWNVYKQLDVKISDQKKTILKIELTLCAAICDLISDINKSLSRSSVFKR